EHRHRACDVTIFSTDQGEQLALLGRGRTSAYRAFDKGRLIANDSRANSLHRVRIYRAHVDDELSAQVTVQDAVRAAIDRFDGGVVKQHDDDHFASIHKRRGCRKYPGACVLQRFCFGSITVPDAYFMPYGY